MRLQYEGEPLPRIRHHSHCPLSLDMDFNPPKLGGKIDQFLDFLEGVLLRENELTFYNSAASLHLKRLWAQYEFEKVVFFSI